MKLNINKIESELKRIDRSRYWLAKKADVSIQLMMYWLKNASLKGAEPIGKALSINPRDLIE